MTDEEKKATQRIDYIQDFIIENGQYNADVNDMEYFSKVLNLIEKQSKEIEELKETLKCTQNSWFEDTQKIEEMKKQLDLDNECEIALNSKIMDLEKEIEELNKSDASKEQSSMNYYNLYRELVDKIKAKIEDILNSENSEAIEKLIEWQSLLEKE